MRIMVQALGIHTGGGPYKHLQGFLKALGDTGTTHNWTFVLNEKFVVAAPIPSSVTVESLRIRNPGERLYQDLVRQRIAVTRSKVEALVNLADFGPLPSTVPTLSFQRNPNYYQPSLLRRRHGLNRVEWDLRRRMAHHVVRRSDRVLCPSETMAESVRRILGVPPTWIGSLYHPYEQTPTSTSWSPDGPRRLLYTSHLMPHKNHSWLLEAYAESGLADNGVELWMTASRDDWPKGYEALLQRAERAGVSDRVRLLGRVPAEEMADLYCEATLFVFASAGESFGFPMIEALSAGLPVLAYDTPIAREILGPAAGYLPQDPRRAGTKLREAMSLSNAELREHSRRSLARARMVSVGWRTWLARLEQEIERMVSQSRREPL